MFCEFFQKKLQGYQIIVETKNDVVMKGTLQFCAQNFNIELRNVEILNPSDFPQLGGSKFPKLLIRGSAVRYIHLPPKYVDLEDLHERTAVAQQMRDQNVDTKPTKRKSAI